MARNRTRVSARGLIFAVNFQFANWLSPTFAIPRSVLENLHKSIATTIHSSSILSERGTALQAAPPTTQPNTTTGKLLFQTKLECDIGAVIQIDHVGEGGVRGQALCAQIEDPLLSSRVPPERAVRGRRNDPLVYWIARSLKHTRHAHACDHPWRADRIAGGIEDH